MNDEIRLIDLLTAASTVATYQGTEEVSAEHLALAAEILRGEQSLDEAGIPAPPLARSGDPFARLAAPLRGLVYDWYHRLGSDTDASLDDDALELFLAEVRAITQKQQSRDEP